MTNNIFDKLDIAEYIGQLRSIFARQKPIDMHGDIYTHYRLIKLISSHEFNSPKPVANLDDSIARLKKKANIGLENIYEFIKIIRYFEYLQKFETKEELKVWLERIVIPAQLLDICDMFDNRGELLPNIDDQLDTANHRIKSLKNQQKDMLYRIASQKSLSPYMVDRSLHLVHGLQCLMVRGGFGKVISARVIDRSSGGFFYILPKAVQTLKTQLDDTIDTRNQIIYKISQDISLQCFMYLKFLIYINKQFDMFDHYLSRVHFAKADDTVFVLPQKSAAEKLVNFKHPALSDPTPIDINLDKNIIIVTGVNAGGKTMLLKSILSAVVLSKHLVPYSCHSSTVVGTYRQIQAVLDDPQDVKNDISTFAGRMLHFSKLLKLQNSLIGVDEIELGTDSDEASALFKVLLDKLSDTNNKIVVTTHHKRLAQLMAKNPQTKLIAALYDEKNRRPTYSFLEDSIGRSYAFETALRYHIPQHLVDSAVKIYGDDKQNLNELITKSENLQIEKKQKIDQLQQQIDRHKSLNQNIITKNELMDMELKAQKQKLNKEYADIIERLRVLSRQTPQAQIHQAINEANKRHKEINTKKFATPARITIGDRVKYNNTKGKVISIKGDKARVLCDSGINMTVDIGKLAISRVPHIKPKKPHITVSVQKPSTGYMKLDLHGQRAEEAVANMDKFISDSLLNGFETVIIYHGIGEGKLSKVVKEFLKEHTKVANFYDAPPKLGGYGAKIVEF